MKKILFLMLLFCLKPTLSFAESCTMLPDCQKLGYYLGYNAACGTDDSRYIFCPYDIRYRKCVNYDCANMGFTADDKSGWCRNIITCKFDEAYTLCADGYEIAATCEPVECTEVEIPSNAHGAIKCMPKAADCSTGTPVYVSWTCDLGFHEENGECKADCPIQTCPAGIVPPDNATCTNKCTSMSSSCVAGQEVCLSYTCNQGFHPEGGLCMPNPVCEPVECTAVSIPGHAHGTTECTPTSTDCSMQPSVYTDWACDSNYHKDGDTCAQNCSIVTCAPVDVPANGKCKTKCRSKDPSCNEGEEVCVEWECSPGFHKQGNTCQADCAVDNCHAVVAPANAHSTEPCVQKMSDCSDGEVVYEAWECNSGYHKKSGMCEKDCTVKTCNQVTFPDNATCTSYCTPKDSECNESAAVCEAWECNDGYHREGNECVVTQTCEKRTCTPVDRPANSHGTSQCIPQETDCSTGSAVYEAWECNSGFHLKNGACEQDCAIETCDPAVEVPDNGYCKKYCRTKDTECNQGEEICTEFACDAGYRKEGDECVYSPVCEPETCTPADRPANAHATSPCTPKNADCSTGDVVYEGWECDSDYHEKNGGCEHDCEVRTCPSVSIPDNAHGTTECTAQAVDCSTNEPVYIAWACDQNYHEKNGGCEHDCQPRTCSPVNVPANAHGTTQCTAQYLDCSTEDPVYEAWECDSGFHLKNGGCEQDCQPVDCPEVTVPAHAHGTTQCTNKSVNCSTGSTVYTAWECNAGYHKEGNACVENDCAYMNSINGTNYVSNGATDYDCQTRELIHVNNGTRDILCYSATVDSSACVCGEGYAVSDDDCGTGKILDLNVGANYAFDQRCYMCVCDQENGYYTSCPEGAACQTQNGCYKTTGCADDYTLNTTVGLNFYITSAEKTFKVGSTNITCVKPHSCNEPFAVSDISGYTNYFNFTTYNLGGLSCSKPTSCKNPYITDCNALGGHHITTSQFEIGGMTCEACGCDISNGWYEDGSCFIDDEENYGDFTEWNCDNMDCPKICNTNIGYYYTEAECNKARNGYCVEADNGCYTKICDNSQGLYTTCPNGAYCPAVAMVNGCYVPVTCDASEGLYTSREACETALDDECDQRETGCFGVTLCSESRGTYRTCPEGAVCSFVDSCFKPTGCDLNGGYLDVDSQNFSTLIDHLNDGEEFNFNVMTGNQVVQKRCIQILGCQNNIESVSSDVYNTNNYSSYFEIGNTWTVGSLNCYTLGCKAHGSAEDCEDVGGAVTSSQTLYNQTCVECKICSVMDKLIPAPVTGLKTHYREDEGGCYEIDGCDRDLGYYPIPEYMLESEGDVVEYVEEAASSPSGYNIRKCYHDYDCKPQYFYPDLDRDGFKTQCYDNTYNCCAPTGCKNSAGYYELDEIPNGYSCAESVTIDDVTCYYNCTTDCVYQYTTSQYSNIDANSPYCERGDDRYYRDLCTGSTTPWPCGNSDEKMYSKSCKTRSGVRYYNGYCVNKPPLSLHSVIRKEWTGLYAINDVKIDIYAYRGDSFVGKQTSSYKIHSNFINETLKGSSASYYANMGEEYTFYFFAEEHSGNAWFFQSLWLDSVGVSYKMQDGITVKYCYTKDSGSECTDSDAVRVPTSLMCSLGGAYFSGGEYGNYNSNNYTTPQCIFTITIPEGITSFDLAPRYISNCPGCARNINGYTPIPEGGSNIRVFD